MPQLMTVAYVMYGKPTTVLRNLLQNVLDVVFKTVEVNKKSCACTLLRLG